MISADLRHGLTSIRAFPAPCGGSRAARRAVARRARPAATGGPGTGATPATGPAAGIRFG